MGDSYELRIISHTGNDFMMKNFVKGIGGSP